MVIIKDKIFVKIREFPKAASPVSLCLGNEIAFDICNAMIRTLASPIIGEIPRTLRVI